MCGDESKREEMRGIIIAQAETNTVFCAQKKNAETKLYLEHMLCILMSIKVQTC